MSWAIRRRITILFIVFSIVTILITTVTAFTAYEEPSCTDGVANQDEIGIDCGGSCPYLCVEQKLPPTVLFTKTFTDKTTGRTAVVASIENKNSSAAARNIPYRITVYGTNQTLIQMVSGTFDMPPNTITTVFVPGIPSGKQTVTNAFLELDSSSIQWFAMTTDPRIIPGVSNMVQSGSLDVPRIEAVLANGSATTLTDVRVVVLVRNAQREIIAASQTIVPLIRPQSTASALFTWNSAFPDIPASIEVLPIIPLP